MSVENGRCPSCGGTLLLDASKEKMKCLYCGNEVVIVQALQKVKIEGIADFDTILLKAQRAMELDEDFDKAAKYYREALELRPDDFRALWGAFLCEVAAVEYARDLKGYVQLPGDIPENLERAIRKYGMRAYNAAPDEKKKYYSQEMDRVRGESAFTEAKEEKKQKKGCYIATCVYGSYDCPQVWVLRRYRDEMLCKRAFGKALVRCYYAFSPAVVKLFGKSKWFHRFWRKRLDKKVQALQRIGVSDEPYAD